ncbi:phosphatidylserine/phosphatidylglycerophosphate/cardiolipin synthase family protein [Sphingomonas sp. KRR8]|uniref:phospholipase D-like domain-containing protein n=1 Tax=Sphingomonas sp. KRR8 TaxID=2942996 RepID=UPI00202043E5|nr:phosphatidylserine/phosphatidylglycerophosphate/cardiolipin synthase family protein [Sphingomonas sp. KRR8]URD60065.1 phosphatidylserine/phosphatidylglycerophosphate/cardiolipin synthase family protein [Sphingomonas sp. KRR8]
MAEGDQRAPITATVAGTELVLIESGAERLEMLLVLIDRATSSLRFLFYMMNPDAAGEAVRDALVRAARRGVAVRVLLDGFGSGVNAAFLQPLVEAGGEFILFHPKLSRRYLLRNHQKLVAVDDRLALIGGANIDLHYLSDHDLQRWRDLWLRLDGPAVRSLARYFDAIYRWSSRPDSRLRELRKIIRRHSQHKGALQWKLSGPVARGNPWPRQLAREIIGGTRLEVISAYFSPPFAMLRRIARLGRRGQVRIVTAAKSDNNATIAAARHTYARLLRNGVGMYEYQPAKLHTKLVVCDDVVHLGSSNLDFRSIYLNLEIMLRIEDAGFATAMRGYFERELNDCLQITPAIHRARASWLRRLKWTISHWLVTAVDYTVTRRLNFRAES